MATLGRSSALSAACLHAQGLSFPLFPLLPKRCAESVLWGLRSVFSLSACRSKCACHQLTVQATGCTPGGQINPNSGYQHKRLEECLPTG